MSHPLDRCVWNALTGHHAPFARGNEFARRYDTDYAPFAATIDDSPDSVAALDEIVPTAGGIALFTREQLRFPKTLRCSLQAQGRQMMLDRGSLKEGVRSLPSSTRPLGTDDVPAMTALVALTNPGPFAVRTVELGHYLGVFIGGALVAMAGERMRVEDMVEISAVCTHPDHRGQGYGMALIAALARAAFDRGETPFLHAFATNETALSVYRKLGFSLRATFHVTVLRRAEDRLSHSNA